VTLPLVRFAYPIFEMLFIFFDDLNAVIRGSAVDDNVLEVWVSLLQHGEDSSLEVHTLIKRGEG
jgi:hypothetical protein